MELTSSFTRDIENLRSRKMLSLPKEKIIKDLAHKLTASVEKKIKDYDNIAIAFSGGVDSTLLAFLCQKLGKKFTLYTVGFPNAPDIVTATETATFFSWPHITLILDEKDIENNIKDVLRITGKNDVISAGVGVVFSTLCQHVREKVILSGLGSEELFAGYERHYTQNDLTEACWEGLRNIWDRDLTRDLAIAHYFQKEIVYPFLDKDLISFAMSIPSELKCSEHKKQILRETAVFLGIPDVFAFRKKRAAQYGSKVDYVIEKLAKKQGMRKSEYILFLSNM